jgi:PAS domain S-box-containing protein
MDGRVCMWNWSIKTGTMDWSSFIDEMLGYKPGGFARTLPAWRQALHPDDREQVMAAITAHLKRDVPFDIEYRLRKQDGSYFWCRALGRCKRDRHGIPLVMSGAIIDISSQKTAGPGPVKQDEHFGSIAKHSSTGVWILQHMEQPDGKKKWIYRFVNQQMSEMLGYQAHEVVNAMGPHDFAAKRTDNLTEAVLPSWEGKSSVVPRTVAILHQIRQKNGDIIGVESYGSATIFEGRPAVIGITTDISGQNAVPGSIGQAAGMQDIDLTEVVRKDANKIEGLLGPAIRLEIITGRQPCYIRAERDQIEQLLMNICVNARDAMPAGGSLTIWTAHIMLDNEYCRVNPWAPTGSYVLLKIADTGCGMDAQTGARIFEPLFTTKPGYKGMGLSAVHEIVTRHKGLIQCYSKPGKGATFYVYIPAHGTIPDQRLEEAAPANLVSSQK